jgi:excisionase family DNA binding protein
MQWITMEEAASLARVTKRTIRNWIDKGAVQATKASPAARRVLVRRSDVDIAHRMETASNSGRKA